MFFRTSLTICSVWYHKKKQCLQSIVKIIELTREARGPYSWKGHFDVWVQRLQQMYRFFPQVFSVCLKKLFALL